ncbi:MAG: hypothetical protein KDB61_08545, partial [Planctomycetes bacterium]|nr:hypothetical protein [Planctomycetota bacterium]
QTFSFEESDGVRQAELGLFVTGVDQDRPSVLELNIGGQITRLADPFHSASGGQWDALELDLEIPAGVTSVGVRILSEDSGEGPAAGNQIASLNWIAATLSMDVVQDGPQYGCDPHFWICRWWRFDPWCRSDNYTETLVFTRRWNHLMGVSRSQSGIRNSRNIFHALTGHGSCHMGWARRALNRHAAAAMLNADSNINYPYTVEQVRSMYQDAVGAIDGPETVQSVLTAFYEANRLGCPW